jgi:hypothetical protein
MRAWAEARKTDIVKFGRVELKRKKRAEGNVFVDWEWSVEALSLEVPW